MLKLHSIEPWLDIHLFELPPTNNTKVLLFLLFTINKNQFPLFQIQYEFQPIFNLFMPYVSILRARYWAHQTWIPAPQLKNVIALTKADVPKCIVDCNPNTSILSRDKHHPLTQKVLSDPVTRTPCCVFSLWVYPSRLMSSLSLPRHKKCPCNNIDCLYSKDKTRHQGSICSEATPFCRGGIGRGGPGYTNPACKVK